MTVAFNEGENGNGVPWIWSEGVEPEDRSSSPQSTTNIKGNLGQVT